MIPYLVNGIHHSFTGPLELDDGDCVNLRDAAGLHAGYDGLYRIIGIKMTSLGREEYPEATVERIGDIKEGQPIYLVGDRPR